MVVKKFNELVVLLAEIWEVNEEARAHVLLHALHLLRLSRPNQQQNTGVTVSLDTLSTMGQCGGTFFP
jgi:hypothetical protein